MLASLTCQVTHNKHTARSLLDSVCPRLSLFLECVSLYAGELSEQQKIELETHRALVLDQRIQLSTLTHKLTAMSQLVEQKDEEKKKLAERLK